MIAKFERLDGNSLARLLDYIHSEENQCPDVIGGEGLVVRIKSVSPQNQAGGTWYDIALDIRENIKGIKVDPKFLLRVYEIVAKSTTNHISLNSYR